MAAVAIGAVLLFALLLGGYFFVRSLPRENQNTVVGQQNAIDLGEAARVAATIALLV